MPRKCQGDGKKSDYQHFVQREQARVRTEFPAAGFGEVMAILGREYRNAKRNAANIRKDRPVAIEDRELTTGIDILDSVAQELDFLTLKS